MDPLHSTPRADATAQLVPLLRCLWLLVGIDLFLVLSNAVPILGGRTAPSLLSLDEELSFVTWYSSAKLLAAAFVATWCCTLDAGDERGLRRLVWPSMATQAETGRIDP